MEESSLQKALPMFENQFYLRPENVNEIPVETN